MYSAVHFELAVKPDRDVLRFEGEGRDSSAVKVQLQMWVSVQQMIQSEKKAESMKALVEGESGL
jgi:hypothetical protein